LDETHDMLGKAQGCDKTQDGGEVGTDRHPIGDRYRETRRKGAFKECDDVAISLTAYRRNNARPNVTAAKATKGDR
jgi:hypothetical protein